MKFQNIFKPKTHQFDEEINDIFFLVKIKPQVIFQVSREVTT